MLKDHRKKNFGNTHSQKSSMFKIIPEMTPTTPWGPIVRLVGRLGFSKTLQACYFRVPQGVVALEHWCSRTIVKNKSKHTHLHKSNMIKNMPKFTPTTAWGPTVRILARLGFHFWRVFVSDMFFVGIQVLIYFWCFVPITLISNCFYTLAGLGLH